jgi:phosphoserine aminotransferase|tara:strand:- start:6250 stop:7326 length:1077 start_codon:yes stop_codon:yes gene_type:complete
MSKKLHNFNAGPSVLPKNIIEKTSKSILNLNESGLSILEISHRSNQFKDILSEARELVLNIAKLDSNEYSSLFLQGGASTQFLMVAYNFLYNDAGYVNTGSWSAKAMKEAKLFGNVIELASSKDKNYNYIPKNYNNISDLDYVHLTTNNTIYGTQFKSIPNFNQPIIADMSSDIFSRDIDYSVFDLFYAGAQKNLGPAGTTLVVIKKEIIKKTQRTIPSILNYKSHIDKDSSFNTPPIFSIYACLLNLREIKTKGLESIESDNKTKADILYDEIDNNSCFVGFAENEDRSNMNVTFNLTDNNNSEIFEKICKERGVIGINGHRSVGGYRASLYNALQIGSVEVLVTCMKEVESLITKK